MEGSISSSPAAAARTAARRRVAGASLSRKPLAPARRVVRGDDPLRRGQPVEVRHPDVHQHHVGMQLGHEPDRLEAVVGLTHDLQVVLEVEDRSEAGPQQLLVVGDQDSDGHAHIMTPCRRRRVLLK